MQKKINLKNEWKKSVEFWNKPRIQEPVIYTELDKIPEAERDVIAWMVVAQRRAYFNMPVLDKKVGRNNFRPVSVHEIGHDTYCPYDLRMCLRLIYEADKITCNIDRAKYFENFFADTLVNTKAVRKGDGAIVDVYKNLSQGLEGSKFWNVYMLSCEMLWNIPKGTLAKNTDEVMRVDAGKIEDIIKKAMDADDKYNAWPKAMHDYADIIKKYHDEDSKKDKQDSTGSGAPQSQNGNNKKSEQEKNKEKSKGVIDYHEPKDFAPFDPNAKDSETEKRIEDAVRGVARNMTPEQYKRLMSETGMTNQNRATTWFYRDLAHQFDVELPPAKAKSGGGQNSNIGVWGIDDPISELDLFLSVQRGPLLPEITTLKKLCETNSTSEKGHEGYPDMMLCLDCSSSMPEPSKYLSMAVLSAMIVAHAAVNHEKKCAVVLFSHQYSVLNYTKNKDTIDEQLTKYLGGGTLIPAEQIYNLAHSNNNPQHIVIISDTDIFNLDKTQMGYLGGALHKAGAGGTVFLTNVSYGSSKLFKDAGYNVIKMDDMSRLLDLSRKLSKRIYGG